MEKDKPAAAAVFGPDINDPGIAQINPAGKILFKLDGLNGRTTGQVDAAGRMSPDFNLLQRQGGGQVYLAFETVGNVNMLNALPAVMFADGNTAAAVIADFNIFGQNGINKQ